MNFRRGIAAFAAAGLALSLAACGDSSTTTETPAPTSAGSETTTATEAPADAGTLSIWVDETRVADFQKLAEDFKSTSGITLDVIEKPNADLKDDFTTQVPTGQGPDLLVGAHDWIGDFVSNGVIAPVEVGDKLSGMTPLTVTAFTFDGQLYGVPYAIENIALVRNNSMAPDTPDTLDALIEQAKGIDGAKYPFVVQQDATNGDPYHLYPIQTSFGAPVFKSDANGEYTTELGMGGAEGQAFAEYIGKLSKEGILSNDITADVAKQAFLDTQTPYIITGPWNIADFQAAGLDVSVLPIPSAGGQPSAPFVGVQGVYLSAKSENALLASQFMDYMTEESTQTKLYDLGGRVPADAAAAAAIEDPILKGFGEAGKDGQAMPAIPAMASVWNFWGGAEAQIISGADPVSTWNTMITNIENAIG